MRNEHSDYLNSKFIQYESECNNNIRQYKFESDNIIREFKNTFDANFKRNRIVCTVILVLLGELLGPFGVFLPLLGWFLFPVFSKRKKESDVQEAIEAEEKRCEARCQEENSSYEKRCLKEKERFGNDLKTRREAIIKNMSKLQGCVDWFMRCFDDGLTKADRAQYQKYVEVVMSFTVFQNSISVTTGGSSYNFDFFKNSLIPLKSQEDTIAFAQAMDQILRSRIIKKYPQDPADHTNYNKLVASIQRTAWNDNRMTLVYQAPNQNYIPPVIVT